MNKVREIFAELFVLGLILFILISGLVFVCGSDLTTPETTIYNVSFFVLGQIIICIWIVQTVNEGSREIVEKHKNLNIVKTLYLKVRGLTVFGVLTGVNLLLIGLDVIPYPYARSSMWVFVYSANILLVSIGFFVWMQIRIKKINDRYRF